MSQVTKLGCGIALAGCLLPGVAVADSAATTRADAVEPVSTQQILAPEKIARFELGYRGSFVESAGFQPFSDNDYLGQVSLAATRTLYTHGSMSFAVGLAWDHAGSSADARDAPASLTLNRLSVPLEGRVHLRRWGYVFARLAPGAAALRVEVDDLSSSAPLTRSRWLLSADLSAGYALPIWTRLVGPGHVARIWLQGEGGFGWMGDDTLDLSSGAANTATVNLGSLALRGAFFRTALAASF